MTRSQWIILLVSGISAGSAAVGCAPGGVGDPCVPEDEYTATFSGFGSAEANVESRSFQCETRVCIVNHFQGRVSCPYGQLAKTDATYAAYTAKHGLCRIPASTTDVTAPAVLPHSCHGAPTVPSTVPADAKARIQQPSIVPAPVVTPVLRSFPTWALARQTWPEAIA